MKLATLASSALATVLVAGSALAYSPADDVNVPTRDHQLGVVSTEATTGEKITVDTASVYENAARSVISNDKVNEYVFTTDTTSNTYGNNVR